MEEKGLSKASSFSLGGDHVTLQRGYSLEYPDYDLKQIANDMDYWEWNVCISVYVERHFAVWPEL